MKGASSHGTVALVRVAGASHGTVASVRVVGATGPTGDI